MVEREIKLTIRQGPSRGGVYRLARDEIRMGRSPENDIEIAWADISRFHARLIRDGESYILEDLGSKKGTFVNGQRLNEPRLLQPGDTVRLGAVTELAFSAPGPVLPREAAPAERPSPGKEDPPPQATVLHGSDDLPPQPEGPPQLIVQEAGRPAQTYPLTNGVYTIGRANDNAIQISSHLASRHHARLEQVDGGYQVVSLPDVLNPLHLQGRPLSEPRRLRHNDVLRIGGEDPGTIVSMRFLRSETADAGQRSVSVMFADKRTLDVGRDSTNDVHLDAPQVSRFHAHLERIGGRYRIRDLRSSNGTFVNDERINGEVWLHPNDQIRIGPYRFVLGANRLDQYDESEGLRVDAIGLNKWVSKTLNILKNISLVVQPREFVVVVGQSGGGKSTLVDALAGYRPASEGRVLVNGIDVYRNFDAIRNDIGYVPQRDIIHMELTVHQALDYAAQLRMPPDTTKAERHRRVMEVLEDLDLVHRRDVQISGLSGGQQKRVSIGVELLTKPGLFFLDEPTSGLDPGTETALMHLMRRLADQGRSIILITHATKNVMLADKVVFLARGGYLAWFGPPEEALEYFDGFRTERERRASAIEFDDIYALLDDPARGSAEAWAERFQNHPAFQTYIAGSLRPNTRVPSLGVAVPAAAQAVRAAFGLARRRVSALRQFLILSRRSLVILTRDRFSLLLMLVAPWLVGALDLVISGLLGRDPTDLVTGSAANALTTLFLLGIYGIMVGGLAQMREFVKEVDIYKRERLVNLKIFPYVLSKVWVAAVLALYQSIPYVVIHYIAFKTTGGVVGFVLIYVTLVLATMAGMMLGLFASALAPTSGAAPMIVIVLMLPQIVLAGGIIPLPGSGQFVSALTSSRWAWEAFIAITGIGSDVARDACWALPEDQRRALSLEYRNANCNCMGVNVFDEAQCKFPAIQSFRNAYIDQAAPVSPGPAPSPPAEPVIPPPPIRPSDPSDTVAVAQFSQDLEAWQAEVDRIQSEFLSAKADFESQLELYQAEFNAYAEEATRWELGRAAAITGAENLIGHVAKNYGWTFVEPGLPLALRLITRWAAQALIVLLLFGAILYLTKRKDVI